MSVVREIFSDDRDQISSGRVFAGYCTVAALLCWLAGVLLPSLQAHAVNGMQAFLAAAATFYSAGKAAERFGKAQAGGES